MADGEVGLTMDGPAKKPQGPMEVLKAGVDGFKEDMRGLMESPRDLWAVMCMCCCAAFTYNTMANVMTVFATAEYGFDDIETGEIYGYWGLMSTLWAMVLGPLIDVLGCRKTGIIGFTIYATARFIIVFVNDKDIFKFTVICISPFAEGFAGLSSSMYGLGIKRYTSLKNRNFAYAMLYAIYNLGGALAGFVIDFVSGSTWHLFGTPISGMRMALAVGFATNMVCWMLAFTLRPIKVEDDDGAEEDLLADEKARAKAKLQALGKGESNPVLIIQKVSKDRNFWRFLMLMFLLVLVKTEWHHNAATLPKFLIRLHGDEVPYASIASINWMMCAVLPPIVQSVLSHVGHIDIIIYGCYIMGIAPFIMVLSPSVGAACIWNVVYTIGEVLWSPRTSTLAAQIAPEGMEATFFSMAAAPQFMAKWPTGVFSGWLLDTYVPECNRCMDNQGHYCDMQPSPNSFYATRDGDKCMSRFECLSGYNASLNDLEFNCMCANEVKPALAGCAMSCHDLDALTGLTTPGKCPTTCYDCGGWEASPKDMWLVIAISCIITPISLTLFRKWIEPINEDGSPMQMSDGIAHQKEPSAATSGDIVLNEPDEGGAPGKLAESETI